MGDETSSRPGLRHKPKSPPNHNRSSSAAEPLPTRPNLRSLRTTTSGSFPRTAEPSQPSLASNNEPDGQALSDNSRTGSAFPLPNTELGRYPLRGFEYHSRDSSLSTLSSHDHGYPMQGQTSVQPSSDHYMQSSAGYSNKQNTSTDHSVEYTTADSLYNTKSTSGLTPSALVVGSFHGPDFAGFEGNVGITSSSLLDVDLNSDTMALWSQAPTGFE